MIKIGITGGIGSGKTEVCKILENLGCYIIYADDLAKHIIEKDKNVKTQVQQIFGVDVYSSKGKLNRKKLARLIFSDENLKAKLEQIVHPVVIKQIENIFYQLQKSNKYKLVFLEAALIYEVGVDRILDYVIVVNASENICINRVMKRDNVDENEVLQRIKTQLPIKNKITRADFVIQNNKDLNTLSENVIFVYNILNRLKENIR